MFFEGQPVSSIAEKVILKFRYEYILARFLTLCHEGRNWWPFLDWTIACKKGLVSLIFPSFRGRTTCVIVGHFGILGDPGISPVCRARRGSSIRKWTFFQVDLFWFFVIMKLDAIRAHFAAYDYTLFARDEMSQIKSKIIQYSFRLAFTLDSVTLQTRSTLIAGICSTLSRNYLPPWIHIGKIFHCMRKTCKISYSRYP